MFVDLMNDLAHTFTERFLRVQLVFNPPDAGRERGPAAAGGGRAPTKRYNALGILEDVVPEDEPTGDGKGAEAAMDVGPNEPPKEKPLVRADPVVVGAGKARPLSEKTAPTKVPGTGGPGGGRGTSSAGGEDWSSVGRNDPCPCGSGRKFKKCHGAQL